MRLASVLGSVLLASLPALASSSLSDQLSVGSTQSTEENPRAGSVSDSLDGTLELNDQFSIGAGAVLTLENRTPAAVRGQFPTSGSAITLLSLGLDYDPNEHLSTGVVFDFSPNSKQQVGTQLTITDASGATQALNARLLAQSANAALGFDVGYDTAGDSNLEWSFTAGVTGSNYTTTQNIDLVRLQDTGKVYDPAQVIAFCKTHKKGKGACSAALQQVVKNQEATLDSLRNSLEVTSTIYADTDVSLGGDFYLYGQDPSTVGIFSVGAVGKQNISGGNGVPIAPLRYTIRPVVAHRFGDLSVKLWVQAGEYASGTAQTTSGIGTKIQYKFTKSFKMWVTAGGQRDVDASGVDSSSSNFALGAGYRF